MNKESFFISQFQNRYIGDDGAVVGEWVYSKDAFFEGVHFKRSWIECYEIARKAMLVNISDAIAMNATPKYALLSVAMPKDISKEQMRELESGFESVASEFDIKIVGGDTLSNTKLDITVTIISSVTKPLYRKGIKEGMFFAYTGKLGDSAKELKKLFRGAEIHKQSKFTNIKLRRRFVKHSQRVLAAGMDISDGLGDDLGKITSLNGVGVEFVKKLPKQLLCSGEEYEMLIAFDKRNIKALKRRAAQTRTPLHIFAKAVRGKYKNRCSAHHF